MAGQLEELGLQNRGPPQLGRRILDVVRYRRTSALGSAVTPSRLDAASRPSPRIARPVVGCSWFAPRARVAFL